MWIYLECSTDSISSQASEDLASPSTNGSDLLPTAKSIPIVKQSCFQEYPNQFYRMHPSGMTYEPLQGRGFLIRFPLTSFARAFHVKGSVLRDLEKAWKMSEADCFSRSFAWPKKSSPRSYSWKMSPQFAAVGARELLEKLPKWGMTVDGVAYSLRPLEHPIKENGGSYLPTPRASHHNKTIREPCKSVLSLKHGISLNEKLSIWDRAAIGKRINPLFAEWMMGYPSNHTALDPLAMQWFQSKRKKRSKS